ncbi:YebC/PmpR family DNA-binding transcriptional regulator [candidate division KSB1 bacterium]|nr:MAG: YebC/PmpR family DNA-binding transcriptional regulator [candidate division KSB1 bacterium]
MSGHSKWSTIKRKKAKVDAQKGKIFTKLIKEIITAAREGGGDETCNPRLRVAVDAAKAANMPHANIEKAIKRGTGELPGVVYEERVYEGYGPGGVAIMVETLTDNINRTTAEVRHLLSKYNGNLGENNCVSWMFEKKGVFIVGKDACEEERLMEIVLEAGADDLSGDEEVYEIECAPEEFNNVKTALEKENIPILSAEITMNPKNSVKVEGKDLEQVLKLLDALEDNDDVQKVHSNFEFDGLPEEES